MSVRNPSGQAASEVPLCCPSTPQRSPYPPCGAPCRRGMQAGRPPCQGRRPFLSWLQWRLTSRTVLQEVWYLFKIIGSLIKHWQCVILQQQKRAEQSWSMSWPCCIAMSAMLCHCDDVVLIALFLQALSSLPFLLTSQFCKLPLLPWASQRAFCSVMPCLWDQVQAPKALAETPQLQVSWTTFRCQIGQGSNSPAEILVGSAKPYLPYP